LYNETAQTLILGLVHTGDKIDCMVDFVADRVDFVDSTSDGVEVDFVAS